MTHDDLMKFWPLIAGAIAGTVWLIRLEGKVKQVEKIQSTEGERMAKAIETMSGTQSKMAESISDMRATLSGIVGYEKGRDEAKRGRR